MGLVKILNTLVLILFLTACSSHKNDSVQQSQNQDLTTVYKGLSFEIRDRAKLSKQEQILVDQINGGEPVSFRSITDLIVALRTSTAMKIQKNRDR